jgi:AraC family transcriptional regulator
MPLRIHFYPDMALCFSVEHLSSLHAHQALQITVSIDRPFDLEIEEEGVVAFKQDIDSVCIAPQQTHRIIGHNVELAYLYVDTSPVAFAKWRAAGGAPRAPDAAILSELRRLAQMPVADKNAAHALAQRWREHALPGLASIRPEDPRIAQAVEIIDAHPVESLNYARLAQKVHLSPSRFASLFREQTGLPVRNYVLWRRLVFVFECLERGNSITEAAHNAGFSDCAHLSRSFHKICGTMPSNITML